jgi:ribosome biogenesis GTPase / thiamine phosphate phosphatase
LNSNEMLKGHRYARILNEQRNYYLIDLEGEELKAVMSGNLRHLAESSMDRPAVGDSVVVSYNPHEGTAKIHAVEERKSVLLRKTAGSFAGEQVIASNLDTVFIVNSLNRELNLRRMERYLVMVRDGGIRPVLVLSKSDLISSEERQELLQEVQIVAGEVPVHVTSMKRPWSMEVLKKYLLPGHTLALIGSSGVGKSTLTNFFLGQQLQDTGGIRDDDDRGKHTTTSRTLFPLENGSFLLDTPGIREIQLWSGSEGLDDTFSDILTAMSQCRFSDCCHDAEPGCSLREALESGEIEEDRYNSYLKLRREQAFMEMRKNARSQRREKEIWKQRSKESRRGRKIYRR